MKNTFKNLTLLMIGPILLSLVWQAKAQTPLTQFTHVDSLKGVQNTHHAKKKHPIFQKPERSDKTNSEPNNLLLTPKRKQLITIRDLLLRPQDRNAIMIQGVPLVQSDSTRQEN